MEGEAMPMEWSPLRFFGNMGLILGGDEWVSSPWMGVDCIRRCG